MEETKTEEGGLSGLKKTLITALGTAVTAGGAWVVTHLGGGEATDKEQPKTEVAAPAQAAPVVINLSNNNTNQQKQQSNNSNSSKSGANAAAAATQTPPPAPKKTEEEPW